MITWEKYTNCIISICCYCSSDRLLRSNWIENMDLDTINFWENNYLIVTTPNISKTLELFNLIIEDFVRYRKESINNKILSLPWPQKPIFKWNLKSFWSSNILNFALGTNIKYYEVKEWKWGNKLIKDTYYLNVHLCISGERNLEIYSKYSIYKSLRKF